MKNYLNFETDIKNIEAELDKLKDPYNEGLTEVDTAKITDLQFELEKKLKEVYSNLNAWQTALVARHEDRPKSKFFIENIFDDFNSVVKEFQFLLPNLWDLGDSRSVPITWPGVHRTRVFF